MGIWGSGLYANDSTCDVRDSYMKYLQEGYKNQDAYQKVLEEYNEYIGDQDEPFLWFALAETQWRTGRLLPEVKAKALEWIEKDGGLELWEESLNGGSGWKKTLNKLRIKLLSSMPPEKKIRKSQEINQNLWNFYDVYAYQFNGKEAVEQGLKDRYMLIQKIGEGVEHFTGELMMRIQILDKIFDDLPVIDEMDGVRILPLDFPERVNMNEDPVWMNALIHMDKKSDYPSKHLTFIGNRQGPTNKICSNQITTWSRIDLWLQKFYQLWQGVEYEIVENGVYRYNKENL